MSDAAAVDLLTCDREPIHIPGTIQPHGILVVLREPDFVVTHVGANVEALLGVSVATICGSGLATLIGAAQFTHFADVVTHNSLADVNPMRLTLNLRDEACEFECVVHRWNGALIAEFERLDTPLRPAIDLFANVRNPIARMEAAPDVAALVAVAAAEIAAISGFDRAMIYRFDAEWNGEVIAEVTAAGVPVSYRGLHFPAADIPAQARRMYLENILRLIPDVRYVPAPLVAAAGAAADAPVDLSRATLRSVSPVHLEYLENMGIRATLTISIVVGGRLWGLVACHHLTPRRIDYLTRAVCELLGQMLAWQIGTQIETEMLGQQLRTAALGAAFLAALGDEHDLVAGIAAATPHLIELFAAQGFVVQVGNTLRRFGETPADDGVIRAIAAGLAPTLDGGSAATHHVGAIVPGAGHIAGTASGALLITLNDGGDNYLLIFRGEMLREVHWGGDIREHTIERDGRLHPRASFALWRQPVCGQSARWSSADAAASRTVRQHILERSQIIERGQAEARICFLAHHDVLTQLPNRASVHDILQTSMREARRTASMLAVLFIDIDHFKLFNDAFGHATGDRILQAAAARMRRCVRHDDVVARLGGDEFVIVLRDLGSERDAEVVAEKVLAVIAEPLMVAALPEIRFTVSVGIAVYPADADDVDALLGHADLAMYRAKTNGRNAHARFDAGDAGPTYERLTLERRIERGLEAGEFVPYYQPIVDARSGRLVAMEALARWNHPDEGVLPPARFIALAEETRLIVTLGKAMLRAACAHCAAWIATPGAGEMHVSVNVSARQFRDETFLETVLEALAETGLPPRGLQLELTESLLIGDEAYAVRTLRALFEAGVGMAIDDFGTGYSSLSYLKRLPVDALKIDQSFVRDLSLPDDSSIVRAIIAMAHSLKLSVIAEGVETAEQLAFLQSEGCDSIQGYFIARPQSHADATAFIASYDAQRAAALMS